MRLRQFEWLVRLIAVRPLRKDRPRDRAAGLLLRVAAAIAAAVVPSGGLRPANAQSSEELFRYPQTLLRGTVSATVSVPLEACKVFCSARSGCLGFDYSSSDQICRLFASVGGATQNQQYIAGTRNLVTGYLPPANPPVPAQTKAPPEAKKQESTSQKAREPAPIVRAKPKREKKRETARPRPPAKPTPVPAPAAPAPAARQSKFRICNNHFGTFSVPASRRCPVSGPGSF